MINREEVYKTLMCLSHPCKEHKNEDRTYSKIVKRKIYSSCKECPYHHISEYENINDVFRRAAEIINRSNETQRITIPFHVGDILCSKREYSWDKKGTRSILRYKITGFVYENGEVTQVLCISINNSSIYSKERRLSSKGFGRRIIQIYNIGEGKQYYFEKDANNENKP